MDTVSISGNEKYGKFFSAVFMERRKSRIFFCDYTNDWYATYYDSIRLDDISFLHFIMSNPPVKLKVDGRKLSHEQSEYLRIQAVKVVRVDGGSAEDVIKAFGLHRANIYK